MKLINFDKKDVGKRKRWFLADSELFRLLAPLVKDDQCNNLKFFMSLKKATR